jgi:hypothetical protein
VARAVVATAERDTPTACSRPPHLQKRERERERDERCSDEG